MPPGAFHIELDTHDILLAEGAPTESYVDHDNRRLFENAAGAAEPPLPVREYAPRLVQGAVVAAVRERLSHRAAARGYRALSSQAWILEASGWQHVTIAPGVCELRLRSAFGRPAGDRRTLGALLLDVQVGGKTMSFTDPAFLRVSIRSNSMAPARFGGPTVRPSSDCPRGAGHKRSPSRSVP